MKKTGDIKKEVSKKVPARSSPQKTEKVLLENFVSLQKVLTNLSLKVDNLTNQISQLLELFEISAKALAEKEVGVKSEHRENQKIIEKMDNLLEQNKTIARGVSLLHEIPASMEPLPSQRESFQPSIQRTPPSDMKKPLPSFRQTQRE